MKKTIIPWVVVILLVVTFTSGCLTQEDIKDKINNTNQTQEEVQGGIGEEPQEEEEIKQVKSGDLEISSVDGSFITMSTSRGTTAIGLNAWVSYSFNNTGTVPVHPIIETYVLRADGSIEDQEETIDPENYLDQNPNAKYIYKPRESFYTATLVLVGFDTPYPEEDEIRQFTIKMELRDKGDSAILDIATSDITFP